MRPLFRCPRLSPPPRHPASPPHAVLLCSCDAAGQSGEFYGPLGKGLVGGKHDQAAYKGKAVLMPHETLADEESRAMLWEESEASVGEKFAI